MKKLLLIISTSLLIITLGACDQKTKSLNILVPNGAPSLAFAQMAYTQEENRYNIDTVFGADPLSAAFANESHDVIVAPINLGARLIGVAGAPYRFAGVITWGNLHFVSQLPLDNFDDLDGKTVTLFGENSVPDATVRTLFEVWGFDSMPTIEYVEGVDHASAHLQTNEDAIVLLAEPALSVVKRQMELVYTLDLQDAWEDEFKREGYPQAGVFVHQSLADEVVIEFLSVLEISCDELNRNTDAVADMAVALTTPFPKSVIVSAVPGSHVRFVSAKQAKDEVMWYFSKLSVVNPHLVPDVLPENFFFEGE